ARGSEQITFLALCQVEKAARADLADEHVVRSVPVREKRDESAVRRDGGLQFRALEVREAREMGRSERVLPAVRFRPQPDGGWYPADRQSDSRAVGQSPQGPALARRPEHGNRCGLDRFMTCEPAKVHFP